MRAMRAEQFSAYEGLKLVDLPKTSGLGRKSTAANDRDRDPRSPVPDHPRPSDRARPLMGNSAALVASESFSPTPISSGE
jgi:hypothetical protein